MSVHIYSMFILNITSGTAFVYSQEPNGRTAYTNVVAKMLCIQVTVVYRGCGSIHLLVY